MPTLGRDALLELAEEYAFCAKCERLCQSRQTTVFGSGSSTGPILVVGEAPGEMEEEVGIPFVGEAGCLFMSLLAKALPKTEKLAAIQKIDDDVAYFSQLRDYLDNLIFWTNLVMCRAEDNKDPTAAEILNCRDRLTRTIYAVDPILIIAVGKLAASKLLGKSVSIINVSGELFDVSIPSPVTGEDVRYSMMALVHPAYLLRVADSNLIPKRKGETYKALEALKYGVELVTEFGKKSGNLSILEGSA